jgi:hypothetical protein
MIHVGTYVDIPLSTTNREQNGVRSEGVAIGKQNSYVYETTRLMMGNSSMVEHRTLTSTRLLCKSL